MFAMVGAMSILSCRNVGPEVREDRQEVVGGQLPVGGKVNVQVNLLGTSFSSQRGSYGISSSKPLSIVKELSPGNTIVAELTPSVSSFSDIVKGESLPKDYPYRVFVFDQEDRTFVDYKDFKVGEEKPASFTLEFDGKYIFIAYTDASGQLPAFDINAVEEPTPDPKPGEGGESPKDVPSMQREKTLDDIKIDFTGADVMYFKIDDYSPSKMGNIINVTLMHKTSNLTVDVKQLLYKEYIKDVSITPNYMSGTIKLSTGNVIDRKESQEYKIDQLTFNGPEGNVVSNLVPVNASEEIMFKAKIKQDNKFNEIELPFKLDLGTKYTLTLKMKYNCGAYVSKELWKEFMCHNLGANYEAHPINKITDLYGNKYAWGVKEPVSTHDEEVRNVAKSIPAASPAIIAWQDGFKTENDPCPSGYRIPKPEDYEGIVQYNNVSRIKTWEGGQEYLMEFGKDFILPFAGFRQYASGNDNVPHLNVHGYYWTSHSDVKNENKYFITTSQTIQVATNIQYHSIRCIAEDGNVAVRPDIPSVGTGWEGEKDIDVDIDDILKKRKEKEREEKRKKKKGNK